MKVRVISAIALGVLSFNNVSAANSCIAGPPVKVSGMLRGRVIDPSGAPIAEAELQVLDEKQKDVADIRADAKGQFGFDFSRLPKGNYSITMPSPVGFNSYIGRVLVGPSRFPFWKGRLILKAGISSCESGIGRDRLL